MKRLTALSVIVSALALSLIACDVMCRQKNHHHHGHQFQHNVVRHNMRGTGLSRPMPSHVVHSDNFCDGYEWCREVKNLWRAIHTEEQPDEPSLESAASSTSESPSSLVDLDDDSQWELDDAFHQFVVDRDDDDNQGDDGMYWSDLDDDTLVFHFDTDVHDPSIMEQDSEEDDYLSDDDGEDDGTRDDDLYYDDDDDAANDDDDSLDNWNLP